jgi:hypothetical protein
MLHHSDGCDLPTIAAMLYEDNATIPVTEERLLAVLDSVMSAVKLSHMDMKHALIKQLKNAKRFATHWLVPPEWKAEAEDITVKETDDADDFNVLDKASSLFRCDTDDCKDLFGHTTIFDHCHFRSMKWVHILPRLQHEAEADPVVRMVLKALKLPEDTSLAAVEQLNGRLMCLCGHPDFRKPITFGLLVCSALSLTASRPFFD